MSGGHQLLKVCKVSKLYLRESFRNNFPLFLHKLDPAVNLKFNNLEAIKTLQDPKCHRYSFSNIQEKCQIKPFHWRTAFWQGSLIMLINTTTLLIAQTSKKNHLWRKWKNALKSSFELYRFLEVEGTCILIKSSKIKLFLETNGQTWYINVVMHLVQVSTHQTLTTMTILKA